MFRWGHAIEAFADLERSLDHLLAGAAQAARVGRQFPPINLYELPEAFVLLAQIPGVDPDSLTIELSDRRLTMSGERPRPEGLRDDQFRRRERLLGHWERSIVLPERVSEDDVVAESQDGLLQLTLPKSQGTVRQIQVNQTQSPDAVVVPTLERSTAATPSAAADEEGQP